jgi:NADP-dependent aldehyde dehydrogenase
MPEFSTSDTSGESLDALLDAAFVAAGPWGALEPTARAAALRAVADAIDAAAAELVPIAMEESHLPEARLAGEVKRTTSQLRLFSEVLEDGSYLEATIDHPDESWPSGPRPDVRRVLVPLGPAVVFAAGNFPFAFSVAGGDTASALAAGCPVVLKAHPGHPRLSALTAAFVSGALDAAGAASGTFSIIFGEDAGRAAVDDPRVKVGAFTGSLRGGRALFDRAMSRPDPIPFFGELGSLNPVFVTAGAAAARMEEIVSGYVGSFTFGAGQLCTKPGLLFVPAEAYDEPTLADAVAAQPGAPLLNEHIEHGYHGVLDQLRSDPAIRTVVAGEGTEAPTPTLLMTTASELLGRRDELLVECFGPTSIVVTYRDDEELLAAAAVFDGQLTATVQGEDDDDVAPSLLDRLATRSGRVVWNGWPTGVSVTWAMQHGGPYPATTASATTSVGATAIGRFLRPVAYQSIPDALLPLALRDANPLGIPRRVDGHLEPTA